MGTDLVSLLHPGTHLQHLRLRRVNLLVFSELSTACAHLALSCVVSGWLLSLVQMKSWVDEGHTLLFGNVDLNGVVVVLFEFDKVSQKASLLSRWVEVCIPIINICFGHFLGRRCWCFRNLLDEHRDHWWFRSEFMYRKEVLMLRASVALYVCPRFYAQGCVT